MIDLITSILLLLALAIGLGEVFNALNMPEVVGPMIAGIILGPAILGVIQPSSELSAISLLALFFIILQIGIEASSDVFTKNIRFVWGFALTSFFIPFIIMSAVSFLVFGYTYIEAVSISLAISIPSISITSVLLVKSGLIKIDDGVRLLGAVAMSDVMAFIILVSFHRPPIIIIIDSASLAAFIIGLYYLDMLFKTNSHHLKSVFNRLRKAEKEGVIFAIIIMMGLAVSSIFQYIGISFVLGAFFSGLIVHQNTVGRRNHDVLKKTFHRINSSFFIPMFFSISGLEIVIIPLSSVPFLITLMAITSVIGGTAAYMFSRRYMKHILPTASLGIFGGRGAVGIIIATITLSDGFINSTDYSIATFATVIMAIVFTFVFERALKNKPLLPGGRKNAVPERD